VVRAETPDPAEYSLAPETPAELRARDAEAVAQAQRALQQERAAARAGGRVKVDQADLFNTQNTLFQEPPRSEEIPKELSISDTLYHGTRSKIEGLQGIVYLTTDPREAAVFARGEIPGTGRADRNAPPTVYETASNRDIRVKDINAIVQDEIMNDGDIDPLIRDEVKKAEVDDRIGKVLAGLAKQTAAFPEVIFTSSQTGEGVPELRAGVARLLAHRRTTPCCSAGRRHRRAGGCARGVARAARATEPAPVR
jgi:hypothetical protein